MIPSVASEEPASTPAPPKKQPLLAIRPFRSNDDLLESLKRRRQNMKAAKKAPSYKPAAATEQNEEELQKSAPTSAPAPAHSQRGKLRVKRFF